jgi:hypothetical protein
MPKATLTYSLPDEAMEHRAALAGTAALIALERIAEHCRQRIKYGTPSAECVHELEAVRAMIPHELMEILE